ncbi:MAG: glycogen/starch/alpha-glucan phosphorylase [Candidatus Erginobacter occultus]|nr:glycogen/starch/alpha-glucan phosphorylase [Candidatus Erginobacter occultus]
MTGQTENSEAAGSLRDNPAAFRQALLDHLYFSHGQGLQSATRRDGYFSLAYTVRDYLMRRWRDTTNTHYRHNPRFVYYLSAEYLLGPQLRQNLLYTGTGELARRALDEVGFDYEAFLAEDREPGLGNGGLGRLAACYLDSLATLDIPAVGYGIRYEYGIFRQSIEDGRQVESPDNWLAAGWPWEFEQPDDMVEVGFGGRTEWITDPEGRTGKRWIPAGKVLGEPYHLMVPGFKTRTVNMLRLWRARATEEFDFQLFDEGDYVKAVQQKVLSENITKVLYPNDNTPQGRELRLRQQYFFVACSLRDIIRRFKIRNRAWSKFPAKVVIQLNDTHPVLAIPELMRILVDEERLDWDGAWAITGKVFAYTCHTLLPEALEKWPVDLFGRLLPRHLEIVEEIDRRFRRRVAGRFPADRGREDRMAIIERGERPAVRMANLACAGSFSVNGVAELHSRLLRERTLADFAALDPDKFNNKTNGVSPRRFLRLANPRLSELITGRIGEGWLTDLERVERLEGAEEDAGFRERWREVKAANKRDLAATIRNLTGVEADPDAIFDVMAKRLHEYKRQHLQVLHIITLYQRLLADPEAEITPRVFIFAAKAAPGYRMAKLIILLINRVGAAINRDPAVGNRLKVVFLPNFNVGLAEKIYPGADISEQISLAGMEASGTGNMKFALNGAVTVGTLDGANIEIRESVGPENFFLFGLAAEEVFALRERGYSPKYYYENNPELKRAIDAVAAGVFSGGDRELFRPLVEELLGRDRYLVLADYASFLEAQAAAEKAYRDRERWTGMSILNAARCGFFSSDRAVREYCREIWKVSPLPVETNSPPE